MFLFLMWQIAQQKSTIGVELGVYTCQCSAMLYILYISNITMLPTLVRVKFFVYIFSFIGLMMVIFHISTVPFFSVNPEICSTACSCYDHFVQRANKVQYYRLCLLGLNRILKCPPFCLVLEKRASFNEVKERDCPAVHVSSHQCFRFPCRG